VRQIPEHLTLLKRGPSEEGRAVMSKRMMTREQWGKTVAHADTEQHSADAVAVQLHPIHHDRGAVSSHCRERRLAAAEAPHHRPAVKAGERVKLRHCTHRMDMGRHRIHAAASHGIGLW
jgi:hypothetical protein